MTVQTNSKWDGASTIMKRSGKWYRKNEKEVMEQLGLQPTKNSGSGWIEKEDGQSENVLCQLKSTDANSIKINKQDLDTLEYNCLVAHKLPVFAIQYLQSNEVYLVLKPEVLPEMVKFLKTGKYEVRHDDVLDGLLEVEECAPQPRKVIKSSSNAREQFSEQNAAKYKKKMRSAK